MSIPLQKQNLSDSEDDEDYVPSVEDEGVFQGLQLDVILKTVKVLTRKIPSLKRITKNLHMSRTSRSMKMSENGRC